MKVRSGSRIAFLVLALLVPVGSAKRGVGALGMELRITIQASGDLEGAITEYRTSISQCPSFWRPVYNLGTVLQAKGDLEGAIAQYRAVISEWPNIWQAHLALGNILNDKGEHEGAIAEYRAVIKRRKKDPKAHYHLGHALQAKGDLEGAIVEYRTAIRLQPNYPEANLRLQNPSNPQISPDKSAYRRNFSAVDQAQNANARGFE